jgi:uncharacterized protein
LLTEHAKVLYLFSQAGEITGRKKLQKIVYIIQKLQFDFNQRFYFHFYGPYSDELTLEMEEMCQLELLREDLEDKGNYKVYRYDLTEKGKRFLAQAQVDMAHLAMPLKKLNGSSARFLELVSTVLFFEKLPRPEVEEKVLTLKAKSNYTGDEIEEAYRFIAELKDLCFVC